jgi:hypothetical protein
MKAVGMPAPSTKGVTMAVQSSPAGRTVELKMITPS